jgi:hypothetical protein
MTIGTSPFDGTGTSISVKLPSVSVVVETIGSPE